MIVLAGRHFEFFEVTRCSGGVSRAVPPYDPRSFLRREEDFHCLEYVGDLSVSAHQSE